MITKEKLEWVRLVATVDKKLCEEMELIHEAKCKLAEECDRESPDWSNTLEMLLRKGVRAYKQNAKKGLRLSGNYDFAQIPDLAIHVGVGVS
jgi:hypothetical protein